MAPTVGSTRGRLRGAVAAFGRSLGTVCRAAGGPAVLPEADEADVVRLAHALRFLCEALAGADSDGEAAELGCEWVPYSSYSAPR